MSGLARGCMGTEDGANRAPLRTYDRSWAEIEEMLTEAERLAEEWREFYLSAKEDGDREGMLDAKRHRKALEGVIKTLKWVLGEVGIDHPLV